MPITSQEHWGGKAICVLFIASKTIQRNSSDAIHLSIPRVSHSKKERRKGNRREKRKGPETTKAQLNNSYIFGSGHEDPKEFFDLRVRSTKPSIISGTTTGKKF